MRTLKLLVIWLLLSFGLTAHAQSSQLQMSEVMMKRAHEIGVLFNK